MTPEYQRAVEAIGAGIRSVKRDQFADVDITDRTCFWRPEGSEEFCVYFDSLDLLDLIEYLDTEHGWVVPEEDLDGGEWRTVGDLASLVVKNMHASDG